MVQFLRETAAFITLLAASAQLHFDGVHILFWRLLLLAAQEIYNLGLYLCVNRHSFSSLWNTTAGLGLCLRVGMEGMSM